jgi:hypothetical protein
MNTDDARAIDEIAFVDGILQVVFEEASIAPIEK